MKISKQDALIWFEFFASLPEGEQLMAKQQEIVYAVLSQIELSVEKRNNTLISEIEGLKTLNDRTLFVGNESKFSKGCKSCLCKRGLNAIRRTNKCNLECPFCYNYGQIETQPPIGEGMWEIGETKYNINDIKLLCEIQGKPDGVSYVYLEPFMEISEYYPIIKIFSELGVHQHMYTNGTLVNEENIKALSEAGLDELRFNLGATNCEKSVINNIKLAKKYIPSVGIETPMTPDFYKEFFIKKQMILDTGIDFINCAELHLNENNISNYMGENMYMCRHGYISPVWSRELTLQFMKIASLEKWDIAVHDCSNYTKFVRGMNLKAAEGSFFGANDYTCEFETIPYEAFLPILKDDSFKFLQQEPLEKGYNVGELF